MVPRENPAGADNEQGSLLDTDIAWLAGHFDGDGWIGLQRSKRTGSSKQIRYSAACMIVTTSSRIALRVSDILRALDLRYYVYESPPKVGKDGSPRKRKWNISIQSNVQTLKFLQTLRPYLVDKGKQADLVMEYIVWRQSQPRYTGGRAPDLVAEMKQWGDGTMEMLREDRNREDPSEITRLAPTSRRVMT